jgi:uncharacterized protein (TIGR03086 family)
MLIAVGSESLDLLVRAVDQARAVVEAVRAEQAGLPSPCSSWDVGALVDHVIEDLRQFTIGAKGGRPSWNAPAPHVEPADWDAAFQDGAEVLVEAWRSAGDLDRTVDLPIGTVPVSFVVNQQIAEFAVHTWDLVTATGLQVELDSAVARTALQWAGKALRPEFRGDEASGKSFGPEVPVPADAPIHERLAGFFGRHPA